MPRAIHPSPQDYFNQGSSGALTESKMMSLVQESEQLLSAADDVYIARVSENSDIWTS